MTHEGCRHGIGYCERWGHLLYEEASWRGTGEGHTRNGGHKKRAVKLRQGLVHLGEMKGRPSGEKASGSELTSCLEVTSCRKLSLKKLLLSHGCRYRRGHHHERGRVSEKGGAGRRRHLEMARGDR